MHVVLHLHLLGPFRVQFCAFSYVNLQNLVTIEAHVCISSNTYHKNHLIVLRLCVLIHLFSIWLSVR